MTLECINPPDLPTPEMYTQVVVARGTKLIFVSGQEPEDVHGKLVGRGDFAVQARLVFANLGRALALASEPFSSLPPTSFIGDLGAASLEQYQGNA
ncbi:MAG TPA: Rid family hydrolase, partial [Kofleriaceae bacterium]|nr:Rid family hydrolase [Kofleriaceae bacterium]